MFGSEILDVGIGLVLVYLLGSLVCSALKEGIANVTKLRANTLETEILTMLQSPDLLKRIYDNPLVRELKQSIRFSKKDLDEQSKQLEKDKDTKDARPTYIATADFAQAIIDTMMQVKGTKEEIETEFQKLKNEIGKIPYVPIREKLLGIMADIKTGAQGVELKLENIRKDVEKWFDNGMTKLSAWYKKKARLIIFIVGFIFCILFNLDTIMMSKALYQNQALRDSMVKIAATTAQTYEKDKKSINIQEIKQELDKAGFPIGWHLDAKAPKDILGVGNTVLWWIYKILGLLITALALSMGAPFWYEALQKLLSFRTQLSGDKTNNK